MIRSIIYPVRSMILGLFTTQVLATIHVYRSNVALYRSVSLLNEAGYLVVPNALVAPTLKTLGSAFCGGLFFTLSLGAGLSLFALVSAWTWDRLFGRNRGALMPFLLVWLGMILGVNNAHISPMVTTYFVAIPLVVFAATLKWMPEEEKGKKWRNRIIPILPIVLLTLIWGMHADRHLFLDIRDFLLLSNPIGKKVDAFYYRYTLYPATVFKTMDQKTLKTCRVTGIKEKLTKGRVETLLIERDYLPVAAAGIVDLEIDGSGSRLVFKHQGKTVLETEQKTFLAQPNETLHLFSKRTDSHAFFRQATIVGLLIGFPVLLYILVFSVLHFVARVFSGPNTAMVISATLCFLIGLSLLAPLVVGRIGQVERSRVPTALQSESWQERVLALRTVVGERLDIYQLTNDGRSLTSPHLPERYWMAKALGVSRASKAYSALVQLLGDSHPNVVSMAFLSLGQNGGRRAIQDILRHMKTSHHWYNQWYAYRALKALRWRQATPAHL